MSLYLAGVSREELLSDLIGDKLRAACEGDPKWNQFVDEDKHQAEEYNRLVEEIENLKKTNAESKQVKILELRQIVANSKSGVAYWQRGQREGELEKSQLEDDLKAVTSDQERRSIQRRLQEVDREIQSIKSMVQINDGYANQYGEELKQLESTIKEEGSGSTANSKLADRIIQERGVGGTNACATPTQNDPPTIANTSEASNIATPILAAGEPVRDTNVQSLSSSASTPSVRPPAESPSTAVRSTSSQSTPHHSPSNQPAPSIPEDVSSISTEEIDGISKPDFTNLTVIRWKDERGEVKKFRLKQSIMHRWRNIGNLVQVPRQQLMVWARRMDDEECCEAVLSHWLDHPPRHYPATWKGLYELLDDSQLGQVAAELKQAVDNAI